jgi:protein-S-isoprenylcysteine O-methyltransferase Ste14
MERQSDDNLKRNSLIYGAACLTVAEMILAQVVDGRFLPTLRYLAPLCGIVSLGLMFWPMFTLQRQGQAPPGENYMQATRLVEGGLFAVVRHPQYLGYMGLNLTFILIAQHWLVLLLGLAAIALFYRYARQEEKHLLAKFGRAYEAYMRRVPRFNLLLGIARLVRHRR